jgi:hypothetical protein
MNRKRLAEALAYVDEMRNRLLNQQPIMVPDEFGQRMGAAGEVAPSLQQVGQRTAEMNRQLTSLDQPQDADAGQMAVDIAAGFTPLQYPQAARDFERARRESDPLGMGLATLAAVPVVGGVAKAANVARKADVAAERAKALRIAQENAAKPVSEGGLGLSPANTPEERFQAAGYQPFYHGTQRLDRLLEKPGLDPRRATSGPMPFGTDNPQLASNYATSKADTSRIAESEGNFKNFFQTQARNVGGRGNRLVDIEDTFWSLPPTVQATIRDRIKRIGYENPDTGEGALKLHETPGSSITSDDHIDFLLKRESNNNPLTALRKLWAESGQLYNEEEKLADIYKLAGYPHEISQTNAPWTSAEGVMTGMVRMTNPINTQDAKTLQESVIPALKKAVQNDRSRTKPGADPWAKESRYTPKQWVAELEKDVAEGRNSHVWTSIPDKITSALKAQGFDGIEDISGKGGGEVQKVLIPFDPSQVRSRFAAFDPAKLTSPDLLAGVAGPTVLAAALMEQERRKKERKEKGL